MNKGLLFALGLLLILMLGYGFFYSQKSEQFDNQSNTIQQQQSKGSSAKIMISWVKQYTVNNAYKNG